MEEQPVVILACRVLQGCIEPRLPCRVRGLTYLDYGLHLTPRLMAQSLQERIDALQDPCTVLIGYGLCGNGIVGLKSRQHTLVMPRTDDCIAILLGSYETYLDEMRAIPGTYFLTRGWLESGHEPLSEYEEYCGRYGAERAGWIMDEQYRNYRRLCLVACSDEDLSASRRRALEVARFCRARWNWRYEERLGSDALIRSFLGFCTPGPHSNSRQFVVLLPGSEVRQSHFLRT